MTGKKLAFKRMMQEKVFQWGVIRSVFDWTVILYIAVPTIFFFSLMYIEMWKDVHTYWNEHIPFSILLFVILLFSSGGHFRTYLMKADLLSLLQQKDNIYEFRFYGFLFSCFQVVCRTTLLFIILLPILMLQYRFSSLDVLSFFLVILAFQFVFLTCKKLIDKTVYSFLFVSLTFVCLNVWIGNVNHMVVGVGSVVCVFVVFLFHRNKLTKTNRYFVKEIDIENSERTKYIKLIFHFSMEIEKEKGNQKQKQKPLLLFRNSKPFFKVQNKENGLLECLLKSFIRNRNYQVFYGQIVVGTSFAILLLPIWFKWFIFIFFIFFINFWLSVIYEKMIKSEFFHVIPFHEKISSIVETRFKKWISVPSIVLIGILSCFATIIEILA